MLLDTEALLTSIGDVERGNLDFSMTDRGTLLLLQVRNRKVQSFGGVIKNGILVQTAIPRYVSTASRSNLLCNDSCASIEVY